MKLFIVLSALAAVALAKPGYLWESAHQKAHIAAPLVYVAPQAYVKHVPAAPLGHDGRVVDTPEVAHAKAEHEAAQIKAKTILAEKASSWDDKAWENKHWDEKAWDSKAWDNKAWDNKAWDNKAWDNNAWDNKAWESLPIVKSVSHQVSAPVTYVKLVPAAPLGHDGRVVDTPEVAHAKAEHEAAQIKAKMTLAEKASAWDVKAWDDKAWDNKAWDNKAWASLPIVESIPHQVSAPVTYVKLVPAAPLGHDGRVVDTPEVAHAKAEHEAAQIKAKMTLAEKASAWDVKAWDDKAWDNKAWDNKAWASLPIVESVSHQVSAPVTYVKLAPAAPLGHDGRVVDTPEVAHAKAEHEAAHIKAKITLAEKASAWEVKAWDDKAWDNKAWDNKAWASLPIVESVSHQVSAPVTHVKLVPAAPLGHDGRVVDTIEVAHAKAEHEAAQTNAKILLDKESAKSYYSSDDAILAKAHSLVTVW